MSDEEDGGPSTQDIIAMLEAGGVDFDHAARSIIAVMFASLR